MKYGQYIGVFCQSTLTLCFLCRRHSELRSESDRKVASLEGRLEATIRKYETQLHDLQMENERLKSGAAATEHRDNGKESFLMTFFSLRADFFPPVLTFDVCRFQREEERFHVHEKRGENVNKNCIFLSS